MVYANLVHEVRAPKVLTGTPKARNGVQGFTAHDTTSGGIPFILDSKLIGLLKLLPGPSCALSIRMALLRRNLASLVFAVR